MDQPTPPPASLPSRIRWLLLAVLVLGVAARFFGLNWDQSAGQHPDERHLMMCTWRLEWPTSVAQYFNEAESPLNPRNREAHFYAYGTLPGTLLRGVVELGGLKTPEQMGLAGRTLAALADTAVIGLVFALAWSLYRRAETALLAALLYALAVLPIQHAHFFVVDPFANFFVTLALVWLVRAWRGGRLLDYAGVGLALGLAFSCKISVGTFGLVVAAAALLPSPRNRPGLLPFLFQAALRVLVFSIAVVVTVRIALPDAFAGFWPWQLAPRWLANMREVLAISNGTTDIPFTRQFYGRIPLLWPWWNMVVWGLGLALGLAAWISWACAGWQTLRHRAWAHVIPVVWVAVVFFHLGFTYQGTLRYFLPAYASLCVLAAWGLSRLARLDSTPATSLPSAPARRSLFSPTWAGPAVATAVVVFTLAWALAFLSIYTKPHTRVEASRWIYENIPPGQTLACEHWDDFLPLPVSPELNPGLYKQLELPLYIADDGEKRGLLLDTLNRTDYIIIASQKLRDSIPRMPHRYPFTISYYHGLEDGSLGFDRVAEFKRDLWLLGLPVSTRGAEEAFSVYDHPPVTIYKKNPRFDPEALVRRFNSISLDGVTDTREPQKRQPRTARKATAPPAPAGQPESAILLPPERWAAAQQEGTWSEMFDRESFSARHPVVVWPLHLVLLQLAGWALLGPLLRLLPDRGCALARPFALLIPAWLLWLGASTGLWRNERGDYWVILALFTAIAAVFAWRARADWRAWWASRENRLSALRVEGVFWLGFAFYVWIRSANPDLWHESWGGEKPMEMTFLYGVLKSEEFPPLNPWYAGGFINYYYFGFVLCSTLIKGLAVLPEVGFNLCLATFFGLACAATLSAARALRPAAGWLAAWSATAFVMVLGNLFQLRFIWNNLVRVGAPDHELTFPLVSDLIRAGHGLWRVGHGERLSPYDADLYWVAARAISGEDVAPVTEFPFWSFLYADLHPHLLSLPFTLCVVVLLVAWLRTTGRAARAGLAALLALTLGFFWPTNTWDWPTYGALTGLVLFMSLWQHDADRPRGFGLALLKSLGLFALIVAGGYLAFLPFHQNYVAGYGSFEAWKGNRTSLRDYLFIHGLFLFLLGTAVALAAAQGRSALARALRLWTRVTRALFTPRRPARRQRLLRLALARPNSIGGALACAFLATLVLIAVVNGHLTALLLAGLLLSVAAVLHHRHDALRALPGLLAFLAFGLSLLVEYVVLAGDIGRMNTVFKFYYQVWVLFGLSAALTLPGLLRGRLAWPARPRRLWLAALAALLAAAALFPATAIPAKMRDRFVPTPRTLDGLRFAETATYFINETHMPFGPDLLALRWLQDNIVGSPVLLEMNLGNRLYSWGSRFAVHTGLPSVVGWSWHQRQQQAGIDANRVEERIADVQTLYRTTDDALARELLAKYGVRLIVVGELERLHAPAEGLEKFARLGLAKIYDRENVQIYEVPAPADTPSASVVGQRQ